MNQSKHTHRLVGLVLILLMSTFSVFAQQAKKAAPNTNLQTTKGTNDAPVIFSQISNSNPNFIGGGEIKGDQGTVPYTAPTHITLDPGSIHTSLVHTVDGAGVNASNIAPTVVNCPMMNVDVEIPFIQSCVKSDINVSYCNSGTQDATNVYIDVALDNEFTLDSAELPYTVLGGNEYRFQLGTVVINDCGAFKLFVTTDCDTTLVGDEHCIQANIYPDTLCNSVINSHLIQLEGSCNATDAIVSFKLTNHGLPITAADQVRFVITEDYLLFQGQGGGTVTDTLIDSILVLGANAVEEIKISNPHSKDYTLNVIDGTDNSLIASSTVAGCLMGNTSNLTINDYHSGVFFVKNVVPYESIDCKINGHSESQTSTTLTPSAKPSVVGEENSTNTNRETTSTAFLEEPITIYAYPNPFSDLATIEIHGPIADNFSFKLYDATGRVVQQKELAKERSFKVQRGSLLPGIYLYRIEAAGKNVGTGKLMIK